MNPKGEKPAGPRKMKKRRKKVGDNWYMHRVFLTLDLMNRLMTKNK